MDFSEVEQPAAIPHRGRTPGCDASMPMLAVDHGQPDSEAISHGHGAALGLDLRDHCGFGDLIYTDRRARCSATAIMAAHHGGGGEVGLPDCTDSIPAYTLAVRLGLHSHSPRGLRRWPRDGGATDEATASDCATEDWYGSTAEHTVRRCAVHAAGHGTAIRRLWSRA